MRVPVQVWLSVDSIHLLPPLRGTAEQVGAQAPLGKQRSCLPWCPTKAVIKEGTPLRQESTPSLSTKSGPFPTG